MAFTPTESNKIAKITIMSEETDMPIRIKLSDSSGISHVDITKIFDEIVDADRKKIAIFKSDGTTEMSVEINFWASTNRKAELSIANPTTNLKGSSGDNFVFLHADKTQGNNTAFVGDIGDTAAKNAWTDDAGVWHFSQDPTVSIKDSTANEFTATNTGSMTSSEVISSLHGKGYNFKNVDTSVMNVGNQSAHQFLEDVTINAFFKAITITAHAVFLSRNTQEPGGEAESGNYNYHLQLGGSGGRITWFHEWGAGINEGVTTVDPYITNPGLNYNVTAARDDTNKNILFYVNGDLKETVSYTNSATGGGTSILRLGWAESGVGSFKGLLSELRLIGSIRSASYIKDTYDSMRDRLLYFETTTPNSLTKKSKLKIFRRLWIRRRLDDSSGDYETEWQNITEFVKKWGSISWQVDEKKYNFISQRGFTLVLDNTKGTFDLEQSGASMFNGFLTRYRTLVRVEAGYIDPVTGADAPNPNVLFYGLTASEPILQNSNQEVIFNVKPLLSVIDEIPANKAAIATDFKTLWTCDLFTDKIYNIQTNGTLISSFPSSTYDGAATSPRGILFDSSDGTLWVTDANSDKIYNIETDGTFISSFANSVYDASAIATRGITKSSDGTLWVADSSTGKIYNIQTNGTLISSFLTSIYDSGATSVVAISFDPKTSTLWTTGINGSTDKIYNIETDGTLISSFLTTEYDDDAGSPEGISFDSSDGTLWVTDSDSDTVYNIKKNGALISSFLATDTFDSNAIAIMDISTKPQRLVSSDFITRVKNVTDGASNFILQKFISLSAWNIDTTVNTLTTLTQIEQIDGISCLELARRLAEVENKTIYVDRSGSFNFVSKTPSPSIGFKFIGLPFFDQTYGHTIKKINNHMDDVDLLFNKVIVRFGDTVTSQVLKEESWIVGDSSTSWKYGVKELSINNDWFSTVTAEKIASNLFVDLATIKTKVDFTTKFVPHLDLLDRVQLKYDPDASSTDTKWNLFNWDEANWANESSPFFNFEGKDFKLVKMSHNLDSLETNFIAREI